MKNRENENNDPSGAERRAGTLAFLEAELARKNARLEELEKEKEATAFLVSIAGAVSRVFRQNIGNMEARDAALVDAARSLRATQIWLDGKFSLSTSSPAFFGGHSDACENAMSLWLAALGLESAKELFRVIIDYKSRLSRVPEGYRALFVPAALFSEYFNAALRAVELPAGEDRGRLYSSLQDAEEKLSRAILACKAEREIAFSIILGVFPDAGDQARVVDTGGESAPASGALAKFIRETKI